MQALTFFLAFVAVLALIGLAAWLVRRFAGNRLGANPNRGRMPRLAVIDAAAVDGRRRLVLVRRDNVEHLLMIGGPSDIVVEQNIVRASQGREQLPPRPGLTGTELPPRIAPLPDAQNWSDNETVKADVFEIPEAKAPELPPRAPRPAFSEDARRPAAAAERRVETPERRETLTAYVPEPPPLRTEPRPEPRQEIRQEIRQELRPEPRQEPRAEPRLEPRAERPAPRGEPVVPRPPRPAEPPRPQDPPRAADPRATEPPRLPEPPKAPPPVRAPERAAAPPPPPLAPPQQSAEANLAEMAQRLEAALRRPAGSEPAVAPTTAPAAPEPAPVRPAPRSEPPAAAAPAKSSFENLEDEMASLLGRPKSSS